MGRTKILSSLGAKSIDSKIIHHLQCLIIIEGKWQGRNPTEQEYPQRGGQMWHQIYNKIMQHTHISFKFAQGTGPDSFEMRRINHPSAGHELENVISSYH